jgi:hypothetical protein
MTQDNSDRNPNPASEQRNPNRRELKREMKTSRGLVFDAGKVLDLFCVEHSPVDAQVIDLTL